MANVRTKVIEIVVLIALAIISQVIVGVLGQVTFVVGNTLNTISGGSTSTTMVNFNLAGVSVTTVLSFMSVIFLIAAVVILLSLFGMENLFKLGGGRD